MGGRARKDCSGEGSSRHSGRAVCAVLYGTTVPPALLTTVSPPVPDLEKLIKTEPPVEPISSYRDESGYVPLVGRWGSEWPS